MARIKTSTTSKPKPNAAQWKAAKEQAAKLTGYGNSSPIWGHKDVAVFADIETHLSSLKAGTSTGMELDTAIGLLKELQKREAFKRLVATLVDTTPVAAPII